MKHLTRLLPFLFCAALAAAQTGGGAQSVVPDAGARPAPRDQFGPTPNIGPNPNLANTPKLSPVFFPAPVPVLDSPLPPAPVVRDSIWDELAPYANEVFFAPLGTRLQSGEMNRRLRPRLDAYREARQAVLAELRSALESPADARPAALTRVAEEHGARLVELAATADQLRRELYRGGFMISDADWSAYRNWRLGEETKRTPQEQLYDEFSVQRAATYYQEGLSLDQRHLLREIALELGAAIGERNTLADDSFEPDPTLFFHPHGSRLRVPVEAGPELRAEIAAFSAAKSTLKRELREALFTLDTASASKRERALRELATRQSPAFRELETAAESIRVRLAGLAAPSRPTTQSGLPAELAARINRYLREKADLQRAAQQASAPAPAKGRGSSTSSAGSALPEFEEKNRARLAALTDEARAIRTEVARISAATGGKTVDALLADFMDAFKQEQLRALYRDYRTAVLLPGLSPDLRQLLFDAAVSELNLPGIKDWQAVPE